jgi:agmatinase
MMQYGDLPEKYSDKDQSAIIIVQVPFDGTSTWIKGADRGPKALLEASANMELYDIETGTEVYRYGIHTDESVPVSNVPEAMVGTVMKRIRDWLNRDKFVVTIGGEHSMTIGSVQAHLERYPNLSVLQLDAHTDLRQKYEGSRFNHACTMARIKELCPVTQVGIRSMDKEELENIDRNRIFLAENIRKDNKWIRGVIQTLNEQVYLTIDLDVFDSSIMPSTGTPEPGGMNWYCVLDLIRGVIKEKQLVGFDIMELCPNNDNKAPDFLAAKLLYKILSYRFAGIKLKT